MNQIHPFPIWIGHGGEGHDFNHILDAGIEAVVELAMEEPSFPTRRDLIACRFPLLDGMGNRTGVKLANLLEHGTESGRLAVVARIVHFCRQRRRR